MTAGKDRQPARALLANQEVSNTLAKALPVRLRPRVQLFFISFLISQPGEAPGNFRGNTGVDQLQGGAPPAAARGGFDSRAPG